MKKYVALFSATAIILLLILGTPLAVGLFLPQIELVSLSDYRYSDSVTASGSVIEQSVKNITVEYPVVPKQVSCAIGDRVKTGDVLATVDTEQTRTMIASLMQSAPELLPSGLTTLLTESNGDVYAASSLIPEEITATSDGELTALNLTSGVLCDAGVVATISETDKLAVKLSVNEAEIGKIKKGQSVIVSGSALKNSYTGKVKTIYPTAQKKMAQTAQETVVDVLVKLDRVSREMKAGFTVQGQIRTSDEENIHILPYAAISQDANGVEYVYVYQSGKAVRRDIETGTAVPQGLQIKSGIKAGEFVVYNAQALQENAQYVGISTDQKKGE